MQNSRRKFLKASMAVGLTTLINPSPLEALNSISQNNKQLNILILGGTSFLGPHQISYALERGHKVTTFTRATTSPKIHQDLFSKVEQLIGDRENNLEALKNKKWDVVIDNSGRKTKWTEDTAKLLVNNVGYYMYTSSISVFYPFVG
mgnify:CR=1 FL=1